MAAIARVATDPYRLAAHGYDGLIEPMLRAAKDQAAAAYPVERHMAVLDVGCGTGAMLERFGRRGCALWGLDASAAMLARARRRLGVRAELRLGDAGEMPFSAGQFDLVSFTMVLHELAPAVRAAALREAIRVVRPGGRLLVLDYAVRSAPTLLGSLGRPIVLAIERMAGAEHWAGYRSFVALGGIDGLSDQHGLTLDVRRPLIGGLFLVAVARLP